jgi:SAM-dependent methyltransferase
MTHAIRQSVELICPVHRTPLQAGEDGLTCGQDGTNYPIADGIPVLLPNAEDRARVLGTDWSQSKQDASPLDFYNQTRDHDQYCRTELNTVRQDVERWLSAVQVDGPTLEIGSGKGALQGAGGDAYVAVDYSFTALRQYIKPQYQRVCATAEQLPFPDNSFRFLFTIAALEHVPNADLAFDEIHRVLKPGGVAYLHPAWHCTQYNCDGIPVRPYKDLTLAQRWVKLTLSLRQRGVVKAAATLPGRALRRLSWSLGGRRATDMRFGRLRPDYRTFWISDSDAASRLDSHEGCLYFQSRGYDVLSPGSAAFRQLMCRHEPVVVRKPAPAKQESAGR